MNGQAIKGAGRLRPALRVATAATLAVAVIYIVMVAGILTLVSNKLVHETDARLIDRLSDAPTLLSTGSAPTGSAKPDADDAPVYFWRLNSAGTLTAASAGAPAFPFRATAQPRFPRTVFVAGRDFRFDQIDLPGGARLYAAESLTQEHHVRSLLLTSALVLSPILLAAVFAAAFTIGRQASKPVERARVRQLEFTADASHELRTPLSVIEAEVGLALATNRTAVGYRDALERVRGESHRLHRIVEDLLWLARFDSEPPSPQPEAVDLAILAQQGADRFAPIAQSEHVTLDVETADADQAEIAAAPESIERLLGVLLDNAIRYAKPGGRVIIAVDTTPSQIALTIADNGPGIPATERARLFDRFHRLETATGQGAGLGLAIADAIVRSTNGRWTIGDAALGGASMTITWSRPRAHTTPPARFRQRTTGGA
ncbi:MAG: sensor histidine kinase [Acidothermaceae bacterium]